MLKKVFLFLVMPLLTMLSFVSCGDEEADDVNTIINGFWVTDDYDPNENELEEYEGAKYVDYAYYFDYPYFYYDVGETSDGDCVMTLIRSTYSIKDGNITLMDLLSGKLNVSGDKFTINGAWGESMALIKHDIPSVWKKAIQTGRYCTISEWYAGKDKPYYGNNEGSEEKAPSSEDNPQQGVTVSGENGGYAYVDLGLPSGTLWATCNVGASKPTEYGDLFAWGETSTKKTFTEENYKFFKIKDDRIEEITKYNTKSKYGTVDNKTVLEPQDDAASVNWGGLWRMPTEEEKEELREGCDWTWTNNYEDSGVAGRIGKSKTNGNTIFLPAAGNANYEDRYDGGSLGCYWCSSLRSEIYACRLRFVSSGFVSTYCRRFWGCSVRAVCPSKK